MTLASLLDSLDLKTVLSEGILRELLDIVFLELYDLIFALEVPLDLLDAHVPLDLEQDELVRDDSHLLECDSLQACAGESLDDPARASMAVPLKLLDLHLDQLDHDLVLDIAVGLPRFDDLLSEL